MEVVVDGYSGIYIGVMTYSRATNAVAHKVQCQTSTVTNYSYLENIQTV